MSQDQQPLDLAALAEHYSAAWNRHDLDAIVAMHTADSGFHSHGRGQAPVQGRDALRVEFGAVLARFPGFAAAPSRLHFGERHWVLDWRLTFQPAGAERQGFRCLDLVEVSADGLISQKDTYYDLAEAAAVLGRAS